MPVERDMIITSDTVLRVLGLPGFRRMIRTPQEQAGLFQLLAAYAQEHHSGALSDSTPATSAHELPVRVPGTALHLRLSKPSVDELRDFVAAAVLLATGTGKVDFSTLGVAAVVSVRDRLRHTRMHLGERCVVEVTLERPCLSATTMLVDLAGNPCRHPRAQCRYATTSQTCGITREGVDAIAAHLTERQVLTRETAVDPAEYRVTT